MKTQQILESYKTAITILRKLELETEAEAPVRGLKFPKKGLWVRFEYGEWRIKRGLFEGDRVFKTLEEASAFIDRSEHAK